ncbi:MAG: twin-arginine translocase TatA/TatE family subunit [Alphaproteobacteria bacterium]
MGSIGIWQIVIVGVVVVLLFGRGKISELMGDVAKGIKSFKKGMAEDEVETAKTIDHAETTVAEAAEKKTNAS